ncbi:MAG: hypothetical protein QT05_C0008G0023 [archaeon GW2011_AR13]|nr:MAG: hypothetical protein QT05_C0008G0023 [archaeon GW2011_AR13]
MTKQLGERYHLKRKLSDDSARDLKKIEDWIKNYKPSKTDVEEPKVEEIPKILPSKDLNFITDENLYKEIVCYMDKTFPSHIAILSGKLYFDGVMKGSNPYIATAVDMFFKSINDTHRIATQKDLETNLEMFRGFYLRGLKLDANLNFNLTEESRYKTANCLNWESATKYSKIDEFGLPKEKDENSSRLIWTLEDGLVGLYLDAIPNLNSYDEYLGNSNTTGRVVLVNSKKELLT